MQIVIDIPKDVYKETLRSEIWNEYEKRAIRFAIRNCTPLPKGHGRLIDENELIDEIVCEEIDGRYYDVIYAHSIYDAETIIEADNAEE